MNFIKTSFFKNLSYAFVANLVSLFGSIFITLFLPKYIGVTEYAYYQLYIFYTSYIGFLGFGWLDGIYLRYGGKFYDKIDKKLFAAQFKAFTFFELIISTLIFIITVLNSPEQNLKFVYICCCICIAIYMPRAILHILLQSTGRIHSYAKCLIIEKSIHILITFIGLLISCGNFHWFIISELIGRFTAMIYIFYVCKDIINTKSYPLKRIYSEIKLNIFCGIALMISNIASMLVIGIARQSIVIVWGIETFGKISLTLSISNLLLVFINSAAMVLFPMLKRIDKNTFIQLYEKIRILLIMITFFVLLLYLPIKFLVSFWLPMYSESFKYMAILFPIIVFESNMCLLINTYMKALRYEKLLLAVNLVSVFISILFVYIAAKLLNSLNYVILGITLTLMLRCILAEFILKKKLQIHVLKYNIYEICLTFIFIISSWYINNIKGSLIYLLVYLNFIYINRKAINPENFLKDRNN